MKYDAFISYRHVPLDMYVAKTLHKELETYTLPKRLRESSKKSRVDRIFRDRDELPLSSDLTASIQEALEGSEFLVVICSPSLLQSEWCIREIEYYKSVHGHDRIFAVLAEGEPEVSFPKELLEYESVMVAENGTVYRKIEKIEPLAADVRGNNKREIKRKIKEESLRILAPIFGVTYDDLRQRNRERKKKRLITILSAAFAGTIALTVAFTLLTTKLISQKKEVDAAKVTQLINESEQKLAEGDKDEAVRLAEEALAISDDDETQYALNKAMGAYNQEGVFEPYTQIDVGSGVYSMFLSPDRNKVVVSTYDSSLYFIDTQTDEYAQRLASGQVVLNQDNFIFLDNDHIIFGYWGATYTLDLQSGEVGDFCDFEGSIYADSNREKFYIVTDGGIAGYNFADQKRFFEIQAPVTSDYKLGISPDGKYLAAAPHFYEDGANVVVIDTQAKKVDVYKNRLGDLVVAIAASNDSFYASVVDNLYTDGDSQSHFVALSFDDGSVLWETDSEAGVYGSPTYYEIDGEEYFFTNRSSGPTTYDAKNGKILHSAMINALMLPPCHSGKDDLYYISTMDGYLYSYEVSTGKCEVFNTISERPGDYVYAGVVTENAICYFINGTDYVAVYKPHHSGDREEFDEGQLQKILASHDFVSFEDDCFSYYAPGENMTPPEGELGSYVVRSHDEEHFMCYDLENEGIRLYQAVDNMLIATIPVKGTAASTILFSTDDKLALVSTQKGDLFIYDADTGESLTMQKSYYTATLNAFPMGDGGYGINTAQAVYVLDENLNPILQLSRQPDSVILGYDMSGRVFILQSDDGAYAVPYDGK